jgi:hypothetical protein
MAAVAPPPVDAGAANPLDASKVIHARAWTPEEAIATALRRRGRTMTLLSDLDLAAASPLLLPSLVLALADETNPRGTSSLFDFLLDCAAKSKVRMERMDQECMSVCISSSFTFTDSFVLLLLICRTVCMKSIGCFAPLLRLHCVQSNWML